MPLGELATFGFSEGLNQVSRENGKRRVVVQANVRGNDLGSFVAAARDRVNAEVRLPAGSFIEWGGQFENLQAASARLSIVIPAIFAAIFGILFMALGGVRQAVAVYSAIPLALAGGVFALLLTGLPFSISAAVGFIVLSGVTVLNGLVVMTSINQRIDEGRAVDVAIGEGVMERVRAVLMTGIVPAIGFVPMALATGTGAEVQKPLAIVVIGGLITSTLLTLFVLPAISRLLLRGRHDKPAAGSRRPRRRDRDRGAGLPPQRGSEPGDLAHRRRGHGRCVPAALRVPNPGHFRRAGGWPRAPRADDIGKYLTLFGNPALIRYVPVHRGCW